MFKLVTELAQEAGMPKSARKGPVRIMARQAVFMSAVKITIG